VPVAGNSATPRPDTLTAETPSLVRIFADEFRSYTYPVDSKLAGAMLKAIDGSIGLLELGLKGLGEVV
jgi:hypothetical protein